MTNIEHGQYELIAYNECSKIPSIDYTFTAVGI